MSNIIKKLRRGSIGTPADDVNRNQSDLVEKLGENEVPPSNAAGRVVGRTQGQRLSTEAVVSGRDGIQNDVALKEARRVRAQSHGATNPLAADVLVPPRTSSAQPRHGSGKVHFDFAGNRPRTASDDAMEIAAMPPSVPRHSSDSPWPARESSLYRGVYENRRTDDVPPVLTLPASGVIPEVPVAQSTQSGRLHDYSGSRLPLDYGAKLENTTGHVSEVPK